MDRTQNHKQDTTIVVHSGRFHTDDVFSVAALQMYLNRQGILNEAIAVIRTRDPELIRDAGFVADVGGVYDHALRRYDHHQEEGAGTRDNGTPYASIGLVWKHYGLELCDNQQAVWEKIDTVLVQPIDINDNGDTALLPIKHDIYPYTIDDIVSVYRPSWNEPMDADSFYNAFMKLVPIARTILEREIKKVSDAFTAKQFVLNAYERAEDKRIIEFDRRYGWRDSLLEKNEPLYVIEPDTNGEGKYQIYVVPKGYRTFEARKPFPEAWGGKVDSELEKISGVEGALFCHRKLFMAVAKNLDAARALARKAIES